jgi:hypothetical protein
LIEVYTKVYFENKLFIGKFSKRNSKLRTMEEYVKEVRKEVERIIAKYQNGEKLSCMETDTFCLNCAINSKSYDSLPKICDDFKFQKLYFLYFKDLNFRSEYLKPNFDAKIDFARAYQQINEFNEKETKKDFFDNDSYKRQRQFELKFGILRIATLEEIECDKEFLENCTVEWNCIIEKTTHSDQRLQVIGKEARDFKKLIEKKYSLNKISLTEKDHQLKVLLWKTKHIHLTASQILEEIGKDNYELYLNNETILFNYATLIHMLNRHFGQLVSIQMLQEDKSFHNPIFQPNKIHLIIENIFSKFNQLPEFQNEKIVHNKPFNFKYRGINYQLYLKLFGEKKDKLFVSSMYPIENSGEINKLSKLKLIKIDSELGIYL